MMTQTSIALLVRRPPLPSESAVLRIRTAHDKMPTHKKRDRRELTTRFGPGVRPDRLGPGRIRALTAERPASMRVYHAEGIPGIGTCSPSARRLPELARGREVSR